MEQATKITLAWELHQSGVSNSQIARDLALNRETVNRWIRAIHDTGLIPFLESYRSSVRKPRPSRQIPVSIKQYKSHSPAKRMAFEEALEKKTA